MEQQAILEALIRSALEIFGPHRLATMALARQGFGNADMGFGLAYPEDGDPPEWIIPAGRVEIRLDWADATLQLQEHEYLRQLGQRLDAADAPPPSAELAALLQRLRNAIAGMPGSGTG